MKCRKCSFENSDASAFCIKCGNNLTDSKESILQTLEYNPRGIRLTIGSTVGIGGRYQVIEELGIGGMGQVYKVLDKEINEKIALKVLRPDIATDENTIERFRNELKLARKLSHRNVCRMYDLEKIEDIYAITMEYVSGEDLKSTILRVGHLSISRTLKIAKQICSGLEEAHRLGVIHRDLKPQNIMIDKEGIVRIMDFGIARSLKSSGLTESGMMIGTPEYMSPEQAVGEKIDLRSDIYSFGIVLFELLTGEVPFTGDTPVSVALKHKTEFPPNPRRLNEQIPDELDYLVMKCLDKDKNNRYQSIEEVLSEIKTIEKDLPTTEKVLPGRKLSTKTQRKRFPYPLLIGIILLSVIIIAGLFFFPWNKEKAELIINTYPEGATVTLSNDEYERSWISPNKVRVLPGEYNIRIKLDKRKPYAGTINVELNKENIIDKELVEGQYGTLIITSSPVGAVVWIDGEQKGTTTAIGDPFPYYLEEGNHQIELKHPDPRWQNLSKQVEIEDGKKTSESFDLEMFFIVSINTNPEGAKVTIGKTIYEPTPLEKIKLKTKTFQLKIEKNGYRTEVHDVVPADFKEGEMLVYPLKKENVTHTITTNPGGASVSLDGKYWGHSPVIKHIPPGKHTIVITRNGYKPITEEITSDSKLEFKLTAFYKVEIDSKPQGAKVFIDNEEQPQLTPCEIELKKNTAELMMKIDGWPQHSIRLDLRPGIIKYNWDFTKENVELEIITVPKGARVYIGEKDLGLSPVKEESVSQGSYTVKIEKEGYVNREETVEVNKKQRLVYELSPLYIVVIDSVPRGATVWIEDKKQQGMTPIKIELTKATFSLRIKKEDREYKDQVTLPPGENHKIFTLTKAQIVLKVNTNPLGARVYLGEKDLGLSPVNEFVSKGSYMLRIEKEDYKTMEIPIEVEKEESLAYELDPLYIVEIDSDPSEATVWIGSQRRGETPIKIELTKATFDLIITKKGWIEYRDRITLDHGKNPKMIPQLERANVELSIETKPEGADVFLGDKKLGTSPLKVAISPGTHTIKIEKEGYQTKEEEIKVESDSKEVYELDKIFPGTITIKCEPHWANVYIDENLIGRVPPVIKPRRIEAGSHTIKFVNDELSKEVKIEIGSGESWEVQMDGKTGKIKTINLTKIKEIKPNFIINAMRI